MFNFKPLQTSSLLGGLLLTTLLMNACQSSPQSGGGFPPSFPVKLQKVESGTVEDSSEFVGMLEAQKRVVLRPQVEGRIIDILVAEGDRVSQGTPIVQLKPDQNQAEVNAAAANVEVQRAALANAQAEVRAAEAEMARLEAEVKRQAAEVQSTEADLELAQVNYKRSQTLVKEGVLAKQDLDDRTREQRNAIASRQAALQSLAATRKALAVAQENRQAAQARVTQAQATLDQAQANLNSTREDLQFTRLQAPIDGIVGDIPVKIGDYVDAGDTLTQITQNNSLNLRVEVPIEQQEQLHFGLPVEIMNGQDQAIASGEITFISPQANTDAQAVLAKATFQNVDGNLRDGQSVRSRLIWQQKEGVLIPSVAISRLGGQTFVFLAESKAAPDGKPQQIARQRPVQLGKLQGNNYQVIQGVEAGDTLVVSGILNLTDGAPITPLSQQSVKP